MRKSVFQYGDYRKFLQDSFAQMPKGGYGATGRLARHLGVHPSLVSQILAAKKSFSQEQAFLAGKFLGLTDLELECFTLLVDLERSGNLHHRRHIEQKIAHLKKQATDLSKRLPADAELPESAKAEFYSHWHYSAIRQATALPGKQSAEAIAQLLGIPFSQVAEALRFLVKHGLCVEKNGRFAVGPQSTHLPARSPWVRSHHWNWRHRAVERQSGEEPSQLFYTCPLTLSASDALRLREQIVQFLEGVNQLVDPSPSEELHCLNVDWFRV